jgi:diguanylate cyclase (GGDEF)-like protein
LAEYLKGPSKGPGAIELYEEESGLFTREYFLMRLNEELNRSKRNEYPFTLALIRFSSAVFDDHMFPNPRYARTLQRLKEMMQRNFFQEDLIARIDETTFAVLVLDTDTADAVKSLDTLYVNLMESNFSTNHLPRDLYCSIGYTSFMSADLSVEDVFQQATLALDVADEDHEHKVKPFLLQ